MLDIVIVVCLLNSPRCEIVRLANAAEGNPALCSIAAQGPIAAYLNEHPKWKVKRYWCVPSGKDALMNTFTKYS